MPNIDLLLPSNGYRTVKLRQLRSQKFSTDVRASVCSISSLISCLPSRPYN